MKSTPSARRQGAGTPSPSPAASSTPVASPAPCALPRRTGRGSTPIYYGPSAADAARAGFDDAFLYEEFRKDQGQRKLPSTQLLGDEAWASFAAWIASPNKIEY